MITFDNYAKEAKGIDFASLPESLQKGHEFIKKVTLDFNSKTSYDTSPTIKKVVDTYIRTLNEFVAKATKPVLKNESAKTIKVEKENAIKASHPAPRPATKPAQKKNSSPASKAPSVKNIHWVERIPDELRFIRRYINMDNKIKTYEQILSLINSLQRAIVEKRIRKSSPFAKQVEYMQNKLLEAYNARKGHSVLVKVAPKTLKEFSLLVNKDKVYTSVQFIKRFISLHGKSGVKEKAKKLKDAIQRAATRRIVTASDIYADKLKEIYALLVEFLDDDSQTRLAMDKESLNGLMGLVKDCGCEGLDGTDVPEDDLDEHTEKGSMNLMNSMDFANLRFRAIGLTGKWLELMGDPAPGFTAMVFGKPKMGKSYLCIEFAGYLSRNHGKVLYVAREEGLDATLQKKLSETHVQNENLFIADDLPEQLSEYDFIFLDSVNKLNLSPADLDTLRKENPGKSFIFVFQTTKDGHFKGKNEFQHDVDIIIEVYEKGKASQYGRYNQGGELDIFADAQ